MQELALLAMTYEEDEAAAKLEEARFRSMLIANNPAQAKDILDLLDELPEDGEFAEELPEDEMEGYQPFSVEEADDAIEQLRRFGVAVR